MEPLAQLLDHGMAFFFGVMLSIGLGWSQRAITSVAILCLVFGVARLAIWAIRKRSPFDQRSNTKSF